VTRTTKAALAADVWRLVLDFFLSHQQDRMRILREYHITPGHMKALFDLDEHEARPMGSLAGAWACDASNVTWIVDRLEERGLVERRTLPGDRRVKAVALTPLGVKTKHELFERMAEPPDDLLDLKTTELAALRAALTRLPRCPG